MGHRFRRLLLAAALLAPVLAAGAPAPDLQPLRDLLDGAVARGEVAGGSLLVIHRGQTVFHSGFGFADLTKRARFPADAPVIIASISKPLLATAVFRLAEAGKLDLDAPVARYLPAFANLRLESGAAAARPPTIQELITHTSGLRGDDAPGGRPWLAAWTRGKSLAEVVDHCAREFPLCAQPGTRHAYSGIGIDVEARAAEAAAGIPRDALLRREVAAPLGMTHTFYRSDPDRPRNLPLPYHLDRNRKLARSPAPRTARPDEYTSSGGSIISTAPDLARWLLMLRNHGRHDGQPYLTEHSAARLLAPAPRGPHTCGGFFVRRRGPGGRPTVIGHTGSSGTDCWLDFERDLIVVLLTQTRGDDIEPFRRSLRQAIPRLLPAT